MNRPSKVHTPRPGSARLSIGPLLLRLGVGIFLLSVAAGVARSLVTRRALPQVGVEYTSRINEAFQQRSPEDALRLLRTAARIDFDNETIVNALLESSRQAEDVEGVLLALEALVRLQPVDGERRNEFVSALLSQGRVVEAYSHGLVATQLTPDAPDAYCNLGAILLGFDEKQQAAAAYRKALELDPTSKAAKLALEFPLRGY